MFCRKLLNGKQVTMNGHPASGRSVKRLHKGIGLRPPHIELIKLLAQIAVEEIDRNNQGLLEASEGHNHGA